MDKFDPTLLEIENLFNNPNTFAAMAAPIQVKIFKTKLFDFYEYPLGVYWIGISKKQVLSIQNAFVTLFILDLYAQNDWICDEESRTTENQFVVEDIPSAEWLTLLQDIWIEDYFQLKYRKPNIKILDINHFQTQLLQWTPDNAKEKDVDSLKEILLTTKRVFSLFPAAYYDKYFGETKEYFFFAESGVYD